MAANLILMIGTKLHSLYHYHTNTFTVSTILSMLQVHLPSKTVPEFFVLLCLAVTICPCITMLCYLQFKEPCCAAWLMTGNWNSNTDWSLIGSDLKSRECSSCRQNRMWIYQKHVCSVCNMLLLLLMLLMAAAYFVIVVILSHVVQMTQLTGSDMFSLRASAWEGHTYVIILHLTLYIY